MGMSDWIEWARGPAFRFALLFLVLGMARALLLQIWSIQQLLRRAANRSIPWRAVLRDTLRWLLPNPRVAGHHRVLAAVSVLFHICIIVTPLFLSGHILLWERGLGLSWPALSQSVADALTLTAIAATLLLFLQRLLAPGAQALSRLQDYLLLVLVGVIFVSGHLISRPDRNPFGYEATLLIHVLTGDLALLLIPFSKLSHTFLFPLTQLVSELGWHLAPNAGSQVAAALHKEDQPI